MEDDFMTDSSISENTTEPGEEEPAPGTESGEAENPPGEESQEPSDNTETPEQEPPAQETGSGDDQRIQEIMDRLDLMHEQGEASEKDKSITERLDALIQLFTVEPENDEGIETYAVAFPFEGYEDWEYPIRMQFEVYPYGYGNWLKQYETFYDPDSFVTRYDEIVSLCQEGGSLKDFYVEYIWEDYGGDWETLVYDYQAVTEPEPEPEPEPEEPVQEDDTVAQLLSHLEDINDTLMEMTAADMEFYESVLLYQEDMLELQKTSIALEIVMAVGIFLTFGALLVKILMEKLR